MDKKENVKMKKTYVTPCAQMNSIKTRDVIALSVLGEVNLLALDSEGTYKRDMEWTWTAQ